MTLPFAMVMDAVELGCTGVPLMQLQTLSVLLSKWYPTRGLIQAIARIKVAKPIIGITYSREESAQLYADAVEEALGEACVLNLNEALDFNSVLTQLDGILLTGGADVDPVFYNEVVDPEANVRIKRGRDSNEIPLIREALARDIPVLGICRGMQALNVALGGSLIQDLPGHTSGNPESPTFHQVFIPPGVRMTAILGYGGFMKVNSLHHQGIKFQQKAPDVLVSAYSLKDGILEAIESPSHRWVVGVQWHPERKDEVPKAHSKLFSNLVWAAQETRRSL